MCKYIYIGSLCDEDGHDEDLSVDDDISFGSYNDGISLISDVSKNVQRNMKKGTNYIKSNLQRVKEKAKKVNLNEPELKRIEDYRRGLYIYMFVDVYICICYV
jgi:hypothetical protein